MKYTYILAPIIGLLFFISAGYISQEKEDSTHFSESVKIALRDSGNQLLLSIKDSTSLISPVIQLEKNKYQLSFETNLSIQPNTLVNSISKSFQNSNLPTDYIVEVANCKTKEVHYSFQISDWEERTIIPCASRNLPTNCYTISVLFINSKPHSSSNNLYLIGLLATLVCIGLGFIFFRKKKEQHVDTTQIVDYISIGNYKFYQDQHKLIRQQEVIKLTAKECELVKIFSQHQNQIIQRDHLIKEIWEDKGVFVGRSLDAFISRLRKKLKDDPSIKIVNVHGVGYKLEVS